MGGGDVWHLLLNKEPLPFNAYMLFIFNNPQEKISPKSTESFKVSIMKKLHKSFSVSQGIQEKGKG